MKNKEKYAREIVVKLCKQRLKDVACGKYEKDEE